MYFRYHFFLAIIRIQSFPISQHPTVVEILRAYIDAYKKDADVQKVRLSTEYIGVFDSGRGDMLINRYIEHTPSASLSRAGRYTGTHKRTVVGQRGERSKEGIEILDTITAVNT